MEQWGLGRRVVYGAKGALGLGILASTLELVALVAGSRLPLTTVDLLGTGVAGALAVGVVAGLLGLVMGVVHLPATSEPVYRVVAKQIGGAGGLLGAVYAWPLALQLWQGGQVEAAAAAALLPLGVLGVVMLNARYWLAQVELGKAPSVGWIPVSTLAALCVIVSCALGYPQRDTGGQYALEGDPNIVLVTMDGLRRDGLSLWGGRVPTPNLDGLASDGIAFSDAVTPAPISAPAHATLLTGLHPLRHRASDNYTPLTSAARTIAEVFEEEGFATSAFVSTVAAGAHSGLNQGFLTYDDDLGRLPAGVGRLRLIRTAATLLGQVAVGGVRRSSGETVARWEAWVGAHQDVPFFSWIHLADTLPPQRVVPAGVDPEALYDEAVRAADLAVGNVVRTLDDLGVSERTLLVVVGTHGVSLGGGARAWSPHGLRDELVRVPLLMRAPGVEVSVPNVEAQVRLMDVPQTILKFAQLDTFEQSEGVELLGYASGARKATMWCSLLGTSSDGRLLGLRNNGIKFIQHLATSDEELYDVTRDPDERDNLVLEQTSIADQARSLLAGAMVGQARLDGLPTVGPEVSARLRALEGSQR